MIKPQWHRRQQGDSDCTLKWCRSDCLKDEQQAEAGRAVCGSNGILCTQIPLGCEMCDPPVIEPSSDGVVKLGAMSAESTGIEVNLGQCPHA